MTTRFVSTFLAFALGALTVRPAGAMTMQDPAAPVDQTGAPVAPAIPAPADALPPPPPPPPAAPIAVPTAPAPAPVEPAPTGPAATDPLAGFSDGTAFLRSPDNQFILFPNGRLQNDAYFFKSDNKVPNNSFLIRRARIELNGWVGPWFFFHMAGDFAAGAPVGADPVAQSNLVTTDDYVGIAPFGDLAILQVGQYDAPFTLENRTSDKYFDYMERSITVRAFGIPSNKEMGAMIHGILPQKIAYYSLGVFNGDGQNYRNADTKFDLMGRGWVAPLAYGPELLRSITVGGSFWLGYRNNALPLATQTTQGGFAFFTPKITNAAAGTTAATSYELHQDRDLQEYAFELNAPIAHKFGARWELVWKRQQPFRIFDNATVKPAVQSTLTNDGGKVHGYSTYGEVWFWALGDDRIIGDPGLQLPGRFKKFGVKAPQSGVMLTARFERLNETVDAYPLSSALTGINQVTGSTKATSYELGINYWYSRRFRGTFNYVLNHFDGDNVNIVKLKNEQEFMFRLAISL
jgi:phosphate-selective porin